MLRSIKRSPLKLKGSKNNDVVLHPENQNSKTGPMYKAQYLSPMVPSFNIEKTVSFFIDLLRFQIARDDKTYVSLYKDNLTVHILRAGEDIGQMAFIPRRFVHKLYGYSDEE